MELIVKTRHVTSNEDPIQVTGSLWLVDIEGTWAKCTRTNDIAYDTNCTMTEEEQADTYARFVVELYAPDEVRVPKYDECEEPIYH